MGSVTACFARVAKTLSPEDREAILKPIRDEITGRISAASKANPNADANAVALEVLDGMLSGATAPSPADGASATPKEKPRGNQEVQSLPDAGDVGARSQAGQDSAPPPGDGRQRQGGQDDAKAQDGLKGQPSAPRSLREAQERRAAGRMETIPVPGDTVHWLGFSGRRSVRADLPALAQRHPEYYDSPQAVRSDIEFVLGKPDGWYIHQGNRVVLFRERMGTNAIPQARVEVEADADTMTVRSVYVGNRRQIAVKMAAKRKQLEGLGLGGQSPDSLSVAEYLAALGGGSSRPAPSSDGAPEAKASVPAPAATHQDPGEKPEAATPAVVAESLQKAAKREQVSPKQMLADALRVIDEAIARAPDNKDEAKDAPLKATINVPGDGTFKVINTKERLREFRALVERSPGFTGKNAKPRVEKAVTSGDLSPNALAREMLSDGEWLNAMEVLDAAGKPMMFGNGTDGEPIPYTDVQPLEIAGFKFFSGHAYSAKKEREAPWRVVHVKSGLAAGWGTTRADAVAQATKAMKEEKARAKVASYDTGNDSQGKPFPTQDELREAFSKKAQARQESTFAEQDRLAAIQDSKERERQALYEEIMGAGQQLSSFRTAASSNEGLIRGFLNAAEKQGRAADGIKLLDDVFPESNVWARKIISDWEKASTKNALEVGYNTVKTGAPPYTMTWDEIEPSITAQVYVTRNARGEKNYRQWQEAHFETVKEAVSRGWRVPDKVLYDYPTALRSDLSDDDKDLASDAMVTTYQQTKDYGKAVQAYRDWKPGIDLKGFERTQKTRDGFVIEDGDITILVSKTKTWDGKERFQARLKNSTTSSSPNLTEQQAIDWADVLRQDMRKAAPAPSPAPAAQPKEPAHFAELRERAAAYWDGTVVPAVREYLNAYDAMGAAMMERNRIKPEGMSAREWLESWQRRKSEWDGSRKTQTTGIQGLSQKDLWPTTDGRGERLRKAMLAAIKALNGAPMTTGEMMDRAFGLEAKAASQPNPPAARSVQDLIRAYQQADEAQERLGKARAPLDQLVPAVDAATKARDALAERLSQEPDETFGLTAKTSDGRPLILTPSPQKKGQYQLTRFGSDGEPWGDSQYTSKSKAVDDFIREADLSTLRVGTEEKLPEGSFMDPSLPVNTGANARMVVIEKADGDVNLSLGEQAPNLRVDAADLAPETAQAYATASDADQRAVRRLQTSMARYIPGLRLDAVAAAAGREAGQPLQGADRARVAAAELLRALTGRRAVFFRSSGGPVVNGVHSSLAPDVLFLRHDATRPHMAVLGHEFLHGLRQDRPDLYDVLRDRMRLVSTRKHEPGADLQEKRRKLGLAPLSADALEEEFLADVMGDSWMDASFWKSLAGKEPNTLLRRAFTAAMRFVDDVLRKIADLNPFGTNAYLSDIKAARAAMAQALRDYVEVESVGAPAVDLNFSAGGDAPWYSALAREIGAARMNVAGPAAWQQIIDGMVKAGKVKADEVEWSGMREWLGLQQGKVTREAVSGYLRANGVRVQETVLGGGGLRSLSDPAIAADVQTLRARGIMPSLNPDDPSLLGFTFPGDGEVLAANEFDERNGDPDFPEINDQAVDAAIRIGEYMNGVQAADDEALPLGWAVEEGADGYEVLDEDGEVRGTGATAAEAIEDAQDPNYTPGTRYRQYTLPGGARYREVLLTLPTGGPSTINAMSDAELRALILRNDQNADVDGVARADLLQMISSMELSSGDLAKLTGKNAAQYKSRHWDQPNVLAHIRLNDRTDADGRRVLFVEEIQSDWGQAAKKDGFAKPLDASDLDAYQQADNSWNINRISDRSFVTNVRGFAGDPEGAIAEAARRMGGQTGGVPRAPFVDKTDKWVALALKRIVKLAVDEGYDRVAMTTGKQQADRYGLDKQADKVVVTPRTDMRTGEKTRSVAISLKAGGVLTLGVDRNGVIDNVNGPIAGQHIEGKALDDVIGKEMAERVMAAERATFEGEDLRVGGRGMMAFYDKIVPAALKDLLRKVGGGALTTVAIGAQREISTNVDDGAGGVLKRREMTGATLQQPGFDITDKMREAAAGGMPMFSIAPPTESDAFKRWFGDSKVVDAQGKPLVLYHGTGADDIAAFNSPFIWASADPTHASGYAEAAGDLRNGKANVLPVYAKITAPFDADVDSDKGYMKIADLVESAIRQAAAQGHPVSASDASHYRRSMQEAWNRYGLDDSLVDTHHHWSMVGRAGTMNLRDMLQQMGFDGVKYTEDSFMGGKGISATTYAAFSPRQIKSATGNRGTFDPNEADIRLSRALTRRDVLLGAAATALAGDAGAKTTLGKAQPIPASVMRAALPADVQKILIGNGVDTTNISGAKAVKEALERIAETGPQELRALAKRTAALMPEGRLMLTVVGGRWNAHGAVSWGGPEGPHLRLMNGAGMDGLTYGTFIHESMHAAVLARYIHLNTAVVRDNDAKLGGAPAASKQLDQFRQVWQEFKEASLSAGARWWQRNGTQRVADAELQLAIDEARSDPDEFFVRALTDPLLQAHMATMEYRGKTLWDRFKDWVKTTLFGLGPSEGVTPSWLDAALTASQDLLEAMPRDAPDYSRLGKYRSLRDGATAKYSLAVDALQSNETARRLSERAMDVIRSDSTIGVLGRTVGTPYHLAHAKRADGSLRNPDLRRVYDEAQDYLNDINTFANDPAELAPGVVPMLNKWSDVARPLRLAGEQRAKLARALFEGTLGWTRDDQGNPVQTEDTHQGIEWTATELKQRFGFDDEDVGRYQQTRAAIGRSLDFMAASEVARQMGGRDLPEGLRAMVSRGDTGRFRGLVTNFLTQQVDGAQWALRMLKTEHREQLAAIKDGPEVDAKRAALKAKQAIALEVAQERLDKWQGLQRGVQKVYDRVTDLKDRGYMPLMRFGPHTVTVRDIDTKEVVFFGMYETQAEANVEARRLRESATPNEAVSRGEMSQEQWRLFKGMSPETVELFGQVAGIERTPVFEEYIRRTKANHSALKRLIQRKGTPGFSEDVQRVLAAFLTSNARAAAANLHAGAMEEATQDIDQERGLVKDYATKLTQYVQNPSDEAQAIRGLMFVQYIGGSVASAMVNMTQPFTMTLPYLSQYGGPAAAARLLTAGMRSALSRIDPKSDLGKAMARAEKDGIVSPQALHELQGQAVNRFGRTESFLRSLGVSTKAAEAIDSNLRKVLFGWGGFFSLAEQFNRRATFAAAYRLAQEQKQGDPFEFASEAVSATQGVYNRGNRPQWARGPVGATVMTFKQFSISYLEFLSRLPRREKAIALAVLMVAAGLEGLPFADDLDDLIDTIAQRLFGKAFSSKRAKVEILSEVFGRDGAEWVLRGASALPGFPVDLAGRMSLGNMIPGTGVLRTDGAKDKSSEVLEALGPAGGVVRDALRGEFLPVAMRNAAKAAEMGRTGQYRDELGRKVADVDGIDTAFKAVGFQPRQIARESRDSRMAQSVVSQTRSAESEIVRLWAQGIVDSEPDKVTQAQEKLAAWNERNPDARIAINRVQIARMARDMRATREDRVIRAAPKELRGRVAEELR